MRDIAIYGAGGFGREVACLINLINHEKPSWNIVGFFDDAPATKNTKNRYGEVLGGMAELNSYQSSLAVVIAIADPLTVQKVAEGIRNELIDFPNLIAPGTVFLDAESVTMGKGNIICSQCLVSCHIEIGNFNIFNGSTSIGHDCRIGDYNVVMPSVNISGNVTMGNANFLGVKSVVLQMLMIGNRVRLGVSSVLMRNANDGTSYFGNPAELMNNVQVCSSDMGSFIKKFEDVFEDTDISTLKPDTRFRELEEWTSMIALSTMAMVNVEYDVELTAEEMRSANTFQELYDTVASHL